MNEETAASPARAFLATLVDVWFDARRAFEAVVRAPRFWAPLLVHFALTVAFTAVWLQKVDPGEFIKTQLEEAGRWDRMPPEGRASILGGQGAGFFQAMAGVGALVGGLGFPLLTAAVLLFIFRFFYMSETDFRRSLAISSWSFLAVAVMSAPLMLLVMHLKDEWNLPPGEVMQAGPALLVERGSTARPLWVLLQGFDLFPLWTVALLALGFAVATRRSFGSALWGVAVPWVLIVLGRAAYAAF